MGGFNQGNHPATHTQRERRELTHSKCVWLMFEIALLLLRSICLMTADLSPPTLVIHIFSNCGPPVKILLPLFFSFFFHFHFKSAANERRRKTQKLSMIKIYRFLLSFDRCHVKLKWGRRMERRIFSLFFTFFQRLHFNFLEEKIP